MLQRTAGRARGWRAESSRGSRAPAFLLLAALVLTGCHSWQPVSPVSPARLDSLSGKPLRVQPVGGEPFDAAQWTVRNDSLFTPHDSLALSRIEQVEVKQPNGGHTAGLIISIALGLFAVAFTTVAIIVHNSD